MLKVVFSKTSSYGGASFGGKNIAFLPTKEQMHKKEGLPSFLAYRINGFGAEPRLSPTLGMMPPGVIATPNTGFTFPLPKTRLTPR